jgi:hypothetical protein
MLQVAGRPTFHNNRFLPLLNMYDSVDTPLAKSGNTNMTLHADTYWYRMTLGIGTGTGTCIE